MTTIETLVHWPDQLEPLDGGFLATFANRDGGRSWQQREEVITTGRGFWRADLKNFRVKTPGRMRAWRALEIQIFGRSSAISLPVFDKWQAPFPTVGGALRRSPAATSFDDDTTYDDATRHAGSVIGGSLAADAALNSDLLRVTFDIGSVDLDALIGSHFSLADTVVGPRAHRIGDATKVSAGIYDVKVWPWTRTSYQAGTVTEFDRPRCTMRLENDDGMALSPEGGRWADVSVTFTEWDPS